MKAHVVVMLYILVALVSGCAFTPQAIYVEPKVDVAPSQMGNDRDVLLNVVDERPRKTLGTVGVGNVGADISIQGSLVNSVEKALSDGLIRSGFKPRTSQATNKSELRVEIRNLDYTVIRGFWAGTLRVDTGLKAICIRDGLRPYEKLYHGEHSESVQVVQPEEANTQYVNRAISSAINSLLSDQALLTCLALSPA